MTTIDCQQIEMMDKLDVLIIGRACVDLIAVIDEFPRENQKRPLKLRLKEGGGQGSTAACCISKLGGKVAYVGHVGDDENGRYCIGRMQAFGVQTDHVGIIHKGRTPEAYVLVTQATGARTILYEKNELPKIMYNHRLEKLAANSTIVLLDPEVTYLGRAFKAASDRRFKIVYDCERWREGLPDMMAVADFFIPASGFLDSPELNLQGDSLKRKIQCLKERIPGSLIVTNGEDGAYCCQDQSVLHIPAPRVSVVDTIGAGDNFHAAFALAISQSDDMVEAVKYAVAVASLSCREYGGRNGIPTHKEAVYTANRLSVRSLLPATG